MATIKGSKKTASKQSSKQSKIKKTVQEISEAGLINHEMVVTVPAVTNTSSIAIDSFKRMDDRLESLIKYTEYISENLDKAIRRIAELERYNEVLKNALSRR